MKRLLATLLSLVMCFALVSACSSTADDSAVDEDASPSGDAMPPSTSPAEPPPPPEPSELEKKLEEWGLDSDLRFTDRRSISVLVWDRGTDNDTGNDTDPADNAYTDYIKEGMLRDHNVVVTFEKISRWTEAEDLALLLAEGAAPDVCYTLNSHVIDTYGDQNLITDLQDYVGYPDIFPNLWARLGFNNIYWNQDRGTGRIWSILGIQAFNHRYVPFIREDWLAALNLPLPASLAEFEAALIAFRDNAELLLDADASQMVPLHMTEDVGWVAGPLIQSFVPDSITDKELVVNDVGGDRNFFLPGAKEGVRMLNRWFNEGLIHRDFASPSSDDAADNMIMSGFVGAIAGHSWDQPYRDGETGWTGRLHESAGPDANFIAVNTFENDAGLYRKILDAGTDRNMFVPATSGQPVAAMLYWDFLSRPEVTKFLQAGFPGINHTAAPNGALRLIAAEPGSREFMTSGMNYDLNMPTNGLDLGDFDLTGKSRALWYDAVDSRLIEAAVLVQTTDVRVIGNPQLPIIQAENGIGDTIRERGNAAWARAIVASVDSFDAVYDSEMSSILTDFAQAAINERTAHWEAIHGNETMLPSG